MKKWIEGHRLRVSDSAKDLLAVPPQPANAANCGRWESLLKKLSCLWREKRVSKEILDDLYLRQRQTLMTLMLLETILLYVLEPMLGQGMLVWYGVILTLTLWRYYTASKYLADAEKIVPEPWHRKLVFQVWTTALLFSLLGLFAFPMLPPYYRLFLFIMLIGISTGVVRILGEDQRTAIGYLLILLMPLTVEMALLGRVETLILAFLTLIYLVSQINLLVRSHDRFSALTRVRNVIETAEELLHEKQGMLQNFFEQTEEGIFTYDKALRILDCNQSFLNFFKLSDASVVGKRFTELGDPRLKMILQAAHVESGKGFQGVYHTAEGMEHWVEVRCSKIKDQEGEVVGGVGQIRDKTSEHLATEELEFLVTHDPLTAVCNRRGFHRYMQRLLQDEEHRRLPTLFFYLDINRFKDINDIYGLEVGDRLLVQGSRRLRELLPEDACLTRMGGDEFSIVIPFVPMEKSSEESVIGEWVEQLKEELTQPYLIQGQKICIDWSIGVVVIEPGMTEVDALIRGADISLMEAKADPSVPYVLYTEVMGEEYLQITQLNEDMQRALETGEFCLYFQPIVRAGDSRMVAAEVLLRWNHPEKGLLFPGDFLPAARRFNRIAEIDQWVLESTCRQIAEWKASEGVPFCSLAVNVDAHLLLRESFPATLSELFRRYGIQRGELTLEVTEDSLVDNFEQAQRVIGWLHAEGVECAIDDFGTGYSSLSYLKKLSFDTLKIDRIFVRDMLESIEDIFLLQTIIDMGKRLNYSIVIEGIETERQREIIAGIDPGIACQGYLISKPIPEEEFRRKFLEAGK
ncbi:EAL domain-containing protein [Nitratifractor sp.]|uniref:putative bifunctional diguanylate cyclase/phosphodiesterase n=1 Tax=Nitratifractor sp. TaxID=2268144 RepID=UPI0025F0F13E|nr:EAL domain-containing protein [Nitratifractor sp.]